VEQRAYELELRAADEDGPYWRTGVVEQSRPFGVVYDGPALVSMRTYCWRVRAHLDDGSVTEWSDEAEFESGILDPGLWRAQWISAPSAGRKDRRTLYFVRDLELTSPVVRGRAFTSGLGWYKLRINGTHVTGHSLVPRWTPFDKTIEYQSYEVTAAFRSGVNRIGMIVGDGRYRGHLGFLDRDARYGDRLAAFAQIVLDLADGSTVVLVTDESWTVGTWRIRRSDPKHGERVDLRLDDDEWMRPGGLLEDPEPAVSLPPHPRLLIREDLPPVTDVARRAARVTRTPSGAQLIDLGQNFAGVARIRLSGAAGSTARLLYSEVLTPEGELNTAYLHGKAKPDWFQRDEVILADEPVDYTPSLTIHGFRYIAVEGADPIGDGDVEGIVLSTDLPQIAQFHCSDPRLEQLWRNVMWSLTSNFTDTPSDCPTRERSGWTGDAQVFGDTAAQLVDVDRYLRRYLANAALEQHADGGIPPIIPAEASAGRSRNPLSLTGNSAGWGDALVILPWHLYRYFGDTQVLHDQYDSARRWVDRLARRAKRRGLARRLQRGAAALGRAERFILDTGYHWGEWLRPGETGAEVVGNVLRPPAVVATAYFAYSARLLSRMARILGRDDDAAKYEALADDVRAAWQRAFVDDGGRRIGEDKQDDYVRALAFDLLPPEQRQPAADRLAELVRDAGFHLGTGFLSTPMLLPALADSGHADVAFRVLMQTASPSWLHQVEHGATTIWETWSGHDDAGRPTASHNHYAFGSVARFLQEYVAGLAPVEPGYRRIRVEPHIGGGLTSASVHIETPYGSAASTWSIENGELRLEVTVPAGVSAEIRLGSLDDVVGAGDHRWTVPVNTRPADRAISA